MALTSFTGKVAAITGAGSGIGRALALALAARGCHLALCDVNADGLAQTIALLQSGAVKVTGTQLDVAEREQVFAWAEQVVQEHGACHLLINNAGVSLGALAEHVTPADFHWLMNINFWGVVHGTQAFMPHLRRAGQGHIVNCSSLFGLLAVPMQASYNASKFAVRGYTESLRQELDIARCGVSATCVHPGGVRTPIVQAARMDAGLATQLGVDVGALRGRFDSLLAVSSPEQAAEKILRGVLKNKRRVLVGADAWWLDKLVRLLGSAYQPLTAYLARLSIQKTQAKRD